MKFCSLPIVTDEALGDGGALAMATCLAEKRRMAGETKNGPPKKMDNPDVIITERTKTNFATLVTVVAASLALFAWIMNENAKTRQEIQSVHTELVKVRFEIERLKDRSAERFSIIDMRCWTKDLQKAMTEAGVKVNIPDPECVGVDKK